MKLRHVTALALIAALSLLPACSFSVALSQQQKAAVADFGSATTTIGTAVPPELTSMRDRAVRMRINELHVIYPVPKMWPTYKNLDKNFEPDTLQARVAAAQVLTTYGTLLEKLVTSSDATALDQAVTKFQGSVSNLAQKNLSTQQLDAIGEAVRAIAGIYIEYKRANALKTIVGETHDQTDALCKLLAADFDPNGGGLMSAVNLAASRLRVDASNQLETAGNSHPQNYGALVKLYWEGLENQTYVNNVGKRMVTAIDGIQKANDDLWQALQAPEFAFNSPAELMADVKEIQAWTTILKN